MRAFKILGIEINKVELIGLIIAFIVVILDIIFLLNSKLFYFILGISFLIAGFPFFVFLIMESNIMKEKDRMFLDFSNNLVENVESGTPISKSILNLKDKDYGSLSPHVSKLANQISLGIPIKVAFDTFARDTNSDTIAKAVNIIGESEKAGGQIEDVLGSVVQSISQIEKLKKERRNAIYGLIVQGYIIFLIFIVIMLIMEFKILPIASGLNVGISGADESGIEGLSDIGGGLLVGNPASPEELARPFLWLLIVQGFFGGLVIGKLSEGDYKSGLKHSFVLMVFSILVNTSLRVIFG